MAIQQADRHADIEAGMTHLVIVGYDEIVGNKYMACIEEAIRAGHISGYSIVDLNRERCNILERIKRHDIQPATMHFIDDPDGQLSWADYAVFEPVMAKLRADFGEIKVYIATELKAHEAYLSYCLENNIDSLVEKPIFAPMQEGRFAPKLINSRLAHLLNLGESNSSLHSVMTLSRYHRVFNDIALASTRERVVKYGAPVTSLHLRAAAGVWNLHREYETREDHPYKYGYGMVMHGGYHYIDLSAQFLALNRLAMPDADFSLSLVCYAAFPRDQIERVPRRFSEAFDDYDTDWPRRTEQIGFGETDVTSTFCLRDERTGRVMTIGTLSLEQTTPSVRSWRDLPAGLYNKNGRVLSVDLEVQLSTLHAMNVKCFDMPVSTLDGMECERIFAQVSTRSNASLLADEAYSEIRTIEDLQHSDSNRALMRQWLKGDEVRSQLGDHVATMQLTQLLCEAVAEPGRQIQGAFSI